MNIKNKNFVVTGGGNGIGGELVLLLLSKGASVAPVDKKGEYTPGSFLLNYFG